MTEARKPHRITVRCKPGQTPQGQGKVCLLFQADAACPGLESLGKALRAHAASGTELRAGFATFMLYVDDVAGNEDVVQAITEARAHYPGLELDPSCRKYGC